MFLILIQITCICRLLCERLLTHLNYTIVWWSFTVWPHEPSGEFGSYGERISDYDIIYRTLHGKPFSVSYLFYPIDSFGFLNSNLQYQNLLFLPCLYIAILGYLHNRIKLLWQLQGQIKLVQLFWEYLYLGISCILDTCLLNDVILSLCALGCVDH